MAFVFHWIPKNLTDSIMRAIVKNEATGRKIKEAIVKKLRQEGETDIDADSMITIDANPTYIRVIIDKNGAKGAFAEGDLEDLEPEFDIEEYLFGKAKVVDDADEEEDNSLNKYDSDLKSIIEGVITGVAPLETIE